MDMMLAGMGFSAISNGFAAYMSGKSAQSQAYARSILIQQQAYQYKSKALQDKVQAGAYIVQGKQYEYLQSLADLNASQANTQMYQAYEMGAWLAMQQGFADREKLSATRVQAAHSGVKMGEGSKKEVYESEYIKKELNRIALQKQTTASANKARIAEANYRAQSKIAGGNAEAAKLMSAASLDLSKADNMMAEASMMMSTVPTKSTSANPLWSALAAGTQSLAVNYMTGYDLLNSSSGNTANAVSQVASASLTAASASGKQPTNAAGVQSNFDLNKNATAASTGFLSVW